jgi:hypothetical protein
MKQDSIARQADFISNIHDPGQLMPWDYLEPLDDDTADRTDDRLEVLQRLFAVIFDSTKNRGELLESGWRRFVALTWVVRPDLFQGMSQMAVAKLVGCTPQNISKITYKLSAQLGIVGALAQSEDVREVKRQAKLGKHNSDTRRPKGVSAHEQHALAVHRACESARKKIAASKPWTPERLNAQLHAGNVITTLSGEICLTPKGRRAGVEVPKSVTWTRFERLALWESGYVDDNDLVTDSGREFFEAATAPTHPR